MAINDFDDWLCKKLTSLDIDNDVYGSYITGILQDPDEEDTCNALIEILDSVGAENSNGLCNDVMAMWKNFQSDKLNAEESKEPAKNIDDIFAAHIAVPSQTTSTFKPEGSSQMDAVKLSVIARYSAVDDDANDDCDIGQDKPDSSIKRQSTVDSALEIMKNTNAESITQAEKMERLKRKEESAKKKEQDKVNRELQKVKKAERKEKEKKRTQKKDRAR